MTLFEECVNAIGNENLEILSNELTEKYFDFLCKLFPILPWARIDWERVTQKKKIRDLSEIIDWLQTMGIHNKHVIVLWNYCGHPGIRTELERVLNAIDDVIAVGSDTFVFCREEGYVIEFFHDGEVTVGMTDVTI